MDRVNFGSCLFVIRYANTKEQVKDILKKDSYTFSQWTDLMQLIHTEPIRQAISIYLFLHREASAPNSSRRCCRSGTSAGAIRADQQDRPQDNPSHSTEVLLRNIPRRAIPLRAHKDMLPRITTKGAIRCEHFRRCFFATQGGQPSLEGDWRSMPRDDRHQVVVQRRQELDSHSRQKGSKRDTPQPGSLVYLCSTLP